MELINVPIKKIIVNKLNPRNDMGDIAGLRKSIVESGLLTPLICRSYKGNGKAELIAGERRFMAITEAIKDGELPKDYEVPVLMREATDEETSRFMLIENLQRKDLTEYEQASSFASFMEGVDEKDAITELSEKTGLHPQYIRRRVRVMSLPKEVQEYWAGEELTYSHMEQLMRLSPEEAAITAKRCVDQEISASRLRQAIDDMKCFLKDALFDKKEAGCTKCNLSTQVQKALFGEDFGVDGVRCLDEKCFVKHQESALGSWKETKLGKEFGTNKAVIYSRDLNYNSIWKNIHNDCVKCESLTTMLWKGGDVHSKTICTGKETCHKEKYGGTTHSSAPVSTEDKEAQRFDRHGKEFSELFFKNTLTTTLEKTKADDLRALRVMLIGLIKSNSNAVNEAMGTDKTDYTERFAAPLRLSKSALTMDKKEVMAWLTRISTDVVMNPRNASLLERKAIAEQFDIVLERDFVITEEYLKKKKKAEIVAMSNKFGVINMGTEDMLKMKKTELIAKFLENDLKGFVPDEILAVGATPEATTVEQDDAGDFDPEDE